MRYNLVKQVAALGIFFVVFFSSSIFAVADNTIATGNITMESAVDLAKDSQSLQAVSRVDKRESEMFTEREIKIDLKAFVQKQIAEMDKEYWHLVIAKVNNYVNVRAIPSEDGEVLGKLYNNSVGEYILEENGWYYIKSGNVKGYVKAEYCIIGEAASKQAKEMLENDTEFVSAESIEEEKARLDKEKKKREEKLKAEKLATKAEKEESSAGNTGVPTESGNAVAEFACRFVGNPYKWGGTSLTDGADCSGFVMSVYANFGVELPHSSKALRSSGYGVGSLSEAIPGDIICYSGHVGIYIGNGQIVHASTKKTGIIISNADYKTILKIRRIF